MQNKNNRNSNIKAKKEELNQQKDIKIINPNLNNMNELSKHKSLDFYNPHSPKDMRNDKKPVQSNKNNSNTNLGITLNNVTNLSGVKFQNKRKSCYTKMSKFKDINKFNGQNSNENIKRNSKQIESNSDKNNKKVSNYKNIASDTNIKKKSNELNNVLSESD